MYPSAHFPDYLDDCAEAFAYIMHNSSEYGSFSAYYIGGSSAGGYISQMLYFDRTYLTSLGIDPDSVNGYVFDAGQPTTHFNVLRERGIDTRAIRIDDAAPLYYIDSSVEYPLKKPKLLFLTSDNDIPCRQEQHTVLMRTLLSFGYSPSRIEYKLMSGYSHCGYTGIPVFADIIKTFIKG